MKRNPTFLLACFLTVASCSYQEKEAGGDSSYSTIRLFPRDWHIPSP